MSQFVYCTSCLRFCIVCHVPNYVLYVSPKSTIQHHSKLECEWWLRKYIMNSPQSHWQKFKDYVNKLLCVCGFIKCEWGIRGWGGLVAHCSSTFLLLPPGKPALSYILSMTHLLLHRGKQRIFQTEFLPWTWHPLIHECFLRLKENMGY